ncbi:uncharacterized protein LOC106871362 [Octopus bimaculoides]|nr:uncharacterized protein LOC106871362 [Octopus bimaculoides]|eukprot:XP_014773257.1 PREDICTED: uncharacterized protein LOC106871362 [Octopus bimaculoides]
MKYYTEGYLAFSNNQAFKLDQLGSLKSGPLNIRDLFDNTPPYVSAAAFDSSTNSSYLFANGSVWKYVNNILETGYPKVINIYVIGAVVSNNKLVLSSLYYITELDKTNLDTVLSHQYRLLRFPLVQFYFSDSILSRNNELVYIDWNGYTVCKHEEGDCYNVLRC